MSGDLQTDLDRSHLDPETKAAAVRVLERTGNADIVEILGLTRPPRLRESSAAGHVERCPTCEQEIDRRPKCPQCGKPFPPDGRRACRRASCSQGPKARGVKR